MNFRYTLEDAFQDTVKEISSRGVTASPKDISDIANNRFKLSALIERFADETYQKCTLVTPSGHQKYALLYELAKDEADSKGFYVVLGIKKNPYTYDLIDASVSYASNLMEKQFKTLKDAVRWLDEHKDELSNDYPVFADINNESAQPYWRTEK